MARGDLTDEEWSLIEPHLCLLELASDLFRGALGSFADFRHPLAALLHDPDEGPAWPSTCRLEATCRPLAGVPSANWSKLQSASLAPVTEPCWGGVFVIELAALVGPPDGGHG
ncbi:hypothetical protein ABZ897_22930 [Nonomuraea sp. NPDC046802]|uniref:hypothetical protein n=1 Tax=Nonomuraea sp. NPDC046802 TaxID=3154919 RepID=UPI0033E524FA